MSNRPRLTPAIADVRRAVRASLPLPRPAAAPPETVTAPSENAPLPSENEGDRPEKRPKVPVSAKSPRNSFIFGRGELVLVALSGGPDSLALAAATAFEAPRAGLRAGAVIVDHGLQPGSADAAAGAAAQAAGLGLRPVLVPRVTVATAGGPEAAARVARYRALAQAASETGARCVLLGHTLDDQAETVLLGLARGSGAASLHGMAPVAQARPGSAAPVEFRRPLLGIRRTTTVQFCADSGLRPWLDPQNADPAFARVRVRTRLLPALESELGPGIAEALARTAEQLREDSDALEQLARRLASELAGHAEGALLLDASGLAASPAALRQRVVRQVVVGRFGVSLTRAQTLGVTRLATDWHGQGPVHLPGIRVERRDGHLIFSAVAPADQTRKNHPRT